MEKGEGRDVEGAIKAETEVVRYAVDADVETCGDGRPRVRCWRQEGRNLAAKTDRERCGWGGEELCVIGVFEEESEDGQGEEPVKRTA